MIKRNTIASTYLLTFALLAAFTVAPRHLAAQSAAVVDEKSTLSEQARKEDAKDPNDEYRHSPMVTKLGSMVGMDPVHASTAFTISNLVILLAGIGYLLWKNLPKSFRSRSATIKKQIVDARSATEEATARLASVEERLSRLDREIAEMKSHAAADGEREAQRLKAAIEDEKTKILAAASLDIKSATTNARRDLQQYATELAVEQAARKLVVTPETDRFLIEGFGERLKAFGKGEN